MAIQDDPQSGGAPKRPHWTQTPEGREKWERLKSEARAKRAQGAPDNPSGTSRGAGDSGGTGSDRGTGPKRTGRDLMGDAADKSRKEKDEPVIDVKELEDCWPGFLQMFVECLDAVAKLVTGAPQVKVEVYFEPLDDTQAKFTGKTTWPLAKLLIPEWAKRFPKLFGVTVITVVLLARVRMRFKKQPSKATGEVIDV